jgi:hypothetical protein
VIESLAPLRKQPFDREGVILIAHKATRPPSFVPAMHAVLAIGLIVALFVGVARSASEQDSFKAHKSKALELRASLLPQAAPQVRAKIGASAHALKGYLARCGKACDLLSFSTRDLDSRFGKLTTNQRDLLLALVFGEALSDMAQRDQLNLQNAMQKQAQYMQLISNIMKTQHDTLKAIIQNLRG